MGNRPRGYNSFFSMVFTISFIFLSCFSCHELPVEKQKNDSETETNLIDGGACYRLSTGACNFVAEADCPTKDNETNQGHSQFFKGIDCNEAFADGACVTNNYNCTSSNKTSCDNESGKFYATSSCDDVGSCTENSMSDPSCSATISYFCQNGGGSFSLGSCPSAGGEGCYYGDKTCLPESEFWCYGTFLADGCDNNGVCLTSYGCTETVICGGGTYYLDQTCSDITGTCIQDSGGACSDTTAADCDFDTADFTAGEVCP